jgi:hypothetical protein
MATIETLGARRAADAPAERARLLTWPNAIAAFVLLIWLLPIRTYRLPAALPFNLEPYRIAIVALAGALLVGMLVGRRRLSAGGMGLPVLVFLAAVLASQVANIGVLDPEGGDSNAMKGFFYLAGFIVAFVVVCSVIQDRAAAERVLKAFVGGAFVVALAALVQSRTDYNVFDHLASWIPVLEYNSQYEETLRGGVVRVRASAQHPIALGTALMLAVPLALYLASRASTGLRANVWKVVALVIALGALAPVARTAIVMAAIMFVFALVFVGRRVLRYWPVLIVALAILHTASPGAIGAMYKSFFPEGGIVSQASGRAGLPGSGRLADIDPGLELWETSPAFGIGRGNPLVGSRAPDAPTQGIIFDNQYLYTLVELGALGLGAVLWILIAGSWRLLKGASLRDGWSRHLIAACGMGVASFAAAMWFFDAFAFVQVTMLFFVVLAVGLKALEFSKERAEQPTRTPECA